MSPADCCRAADALSEARKFLDIARGRCSRVAAALDAAGGPDGSQDLRLVEADLRHQNDVLARIAAQLRRRGQSTARPVFATANEEVP